METEDMEIGEVDSPKKRSQCPWPLACEDLPGIHPDQVALASSPSGY
jgi:hypothetical protein